MPTAHLDRPHPTPAFAHPGSRGHAQEGLLDLDTLLKDLDDSGRRGFIDVLALEGFEITQGIPNLHMAGEIDSAIGALLEMGCKAAWMRLHSLLAEAALYGTLVDLSCGPEVV